MIPWIAQDLLTVLGMAGSLCLFFSLKRELLNRQRRITDLERRLALLEAREPQVIMTPPAPRSGMNLNKRVQALRMLRRQEGPSHVAAALGILPAEVELLVRVQALSKAAGAQ
jgi:hypothetical protein